MINSISAPNKPTFLPKISLKKIWKVKTDSSYNIKALNFKATTSIIIITIDGEGTITLTKNQVSLKKGKMATFKGSEVKSYKCAEDKWEFFWFEIEDSNNYFKSNQIFDLININMISIECENCFNELNSESFQELSFARFCFLYTNIVSHNKIENNQFHINVINKAKHYIIENINRDISIEDVSNFCNISSRYLSKLFHNFFNASPKEYILNKKFSIALEMLKHTNSKINEISHFLGFKDSYYFNRIFKKYMGYTPGSVRKKATVL